MPHLFADAFSFWSGLTSEAPALANGTSLFNSDVPYYLANAVWHPSADKLRALIPWYRARQLPPAVIVTAAEAPDLTAALLESDFSHELSFSFRRAKAFQAEGLTEQVHWTQMRFAGELLAKHYQQPSLALTIAKSLTKALENDDRIKAYLAYQDEPVGTLLTYQGETALTAMLYVDRGGALEHRLVSEAAVLGLDAYVLEPVKHGERCNPALSLERWSIDSG